MDGIINKIACLLLIHNLFCISVFNLLNDMSAIGYLCLCLSNFLVAVYIKEKQNRKKAKMV